MDATYRMAIDAGYRSAVRHRGDYPQWWLRMAMDRLLEEVEVQHRLHAELGGWDS